MKTRRHPSRFISQVTLCALLLSSGPLQAIAGGAANAVPRPRSIKLDEEIGQDSSTTVVRPPEEAKVPAPKPAAKGAKQGEVKPLCEPDSGEVGGGQGAPVAKWSTTDQKKFDEQAKSFYDGRKKTVLEATSKLHMKYGATSKPDLTEAMKVRSSFFDVLYHPKGAVVTICQGKREAGVAMHKYAVAREKKGVESGKGVNACSGAAQEMLKVLEDARQITLKYAKGIDSILQGGQMPGGTRIPGMEETFAKNRLTNLTKVQHASDELGVDGAGDYKLLISEFQMLWGSSSQNEFKEKNSLKNSGTYSDALLQVRKEKADALQKVKMLEGKQKDFVTRNQACASLVDLKPASLGGKPAPSTVTGGLAEDAAGRTVRPGTNGSGGSRAAPPPAPPPPPAPAIDTRTDTRDDNRDWNRDTNRDNNRDNRDRDRDRDNDDDDKPKHKDNNNGVTSFMKDNWMWIVGGAAVVGGGVYLYKKHEDKKKSDAALADFYANPLPSGNPNQVSIVNNVTTVTDTGDAIAPPGSKLILENAIGDGVVGTAIGALTVVLVDANGVVINLNGLHINATCYNPQPCSITGTQQLTTTAGKATFSALVFNQPHTGLKIQFSATGTTTVTMQNAINITGQPRQ